MPADSPKGATPPSPDTLLARLRGAAADEFRRQWPDGPDSRERGEYARLRRDYRTWIRMDDYPEHVRRLAEQVLFTNRVYLDRHSEEFHRFCVAATRILVDFYDDVLDPDRILPGT